MTLEVIWGSGSPYAWRVLLTLEVKGLSYESRLIQFSRGDHRSPEHLALSPRGKVPVLRDGDYVLSESLAIMAYLDRKHSEPPIFGGSAEETGLIWKAIFEFESYVFPLANRIIVSAFGGTARRGGHAGGRERAARRARPHGAGRVGTRLARR
jgi:glutathione S-transferase